MIHPDDAPQVTDTAVKKELSKKLQVTDDGNRQEMEQVPVPPHEQP